MNGPTLLSAYLTKTGRSRPEFAEAVGADRARIARLLSGERGPGLDLALDIERETKGAVPAAAWAAKKSSRHHHKVKQAAQ